MPHRKWKEAKLDTQSLNSEYKYPECIKYSHINKTMEKNRTKTRKDIS